VPDPLARILTLDYDKSANLWLVQLRRADGKQCSVKLYQDAFEYVNKHPLGQILLHMWFSKATPIIGKHPVP